MTRNLLDGRRPEEPLCAGSRRVNVHEDHEVRYWTEKCGVTKQQLADAVKKVGVSIDAVARELGKV
jgi:hypothetical protein